MPVVDVTLIEIFEPKNPDAVVGMANTILATETGNPSNLHFKKADADRVPSKFREEVADVRRRAREYVGIKDEPAAAEPEPAPIEQPESPEE